MITGDGKGLPERMENKALDKNVFVSKTGTPPSGLPGSCAWCSSALGYTFSSEMPTPAPATCLPPVDLTRPLCSWRGWHRTGRSSGPAVIQPPRTFQDPSLHVLIEIQEAVLLAWLKCSSAGLLFRL